MIRFQAAALSFALSATASAAEITLQNDSLVAGGTGVIQPGFVAGEMAASWLTSPCDGDLVAVQIFWRSSSGTAADSIQSAIHIYRSGSFPQPGAVALDIVGPALTDGVINEYRYLDENSTIPISVPVTSAEIVVVALEFFTAPPVVGPSVVNDIDGLTSGGNAIYADLGSSYQWFNSGFFGVSGDWVIRAVVDCDSVPTEADIAVAIAADPAEYTPGAALEYTITAGNAGPAAAGVTVAALFPSSLQNIGWICTASGGAACGLASGSGNIVQQSVAMPMGGEVIYSVTTDVDPNASGNIEISAAASPNPPVTDPNTSNNNATVSTPAADNDLIFADGFDTTPP